VNWLHTLWFGYVWPSCEGNGPEAIVEIAFGVLLGRIVWPKIKAHLDYIKRQNAHIIEHHPDIPPLPEPAP
jgi:hypothetical protein